MNTKNYIPLLQDLEKEQEFHAQELKRLQTLISYVKDKTHRISTHLPEKAGGIYTGLSISAAITTCLERADQALTTTQIMHTLLEGGFRASTTNTQHFLSNITTTLKRIEGAIRIDGKWILQKFLPKNIERAKTEFAEVATPLQASSH